MSAPRRSARIAALHASRNAAKSMPPKDVSTETPTFDSKYAKYLLSSINTFASKACLAIRRMIELLKERAAPDELTAEAIVWLTRLSWAVEDCHEHKTRQLTANYDETFKKTVLRALTFFEVITSDASSMVKHLEQQRVISRSLVKYISKFESTIMNALKND